MSKLSKITLFSILLLLAIYISPCFAWIQQEVTGNWDYYSNTAWKTQQIDESWSTATLFYNQSVSNFTYWFFEHNVLDGYGHGWAVFDQDVEMNTRYIIYDVNKTKLIEVKFWFRGSKEFYVSEDRYVICEIRYEQISPSYWFELSYTSYRIDYVPCHARVWIYRDPSQTDYLNVKVRIYDNNWNLIKGKDLKYNIGSSWFSDIVLEQEIEKWGKGWVECSKTNESIITNELQSPSVVEAPTPPMTMIEAFAEFVRDQWNKIGEALPEPIKSFMANIGGIFGVAWQTVTFVFVVTSKFMPYIGIFYMIYLVIIVLRCFSETSISPLVEHLIVMYTLFAQIVQAVVGIVHAIWSFIKFW